MKILNNDIGSLTYKEIKEEISAIDMSISYKDENVVLIIEKLLNDSRKNVNTLGNKLIKEKNKIFDEIKRVRQMYDFDKSFGEYNVIAGVDEVGRGPLAGPIVSCAVILDLNVLDDKLLLWLNDSKKIGEKKREELASIIKEKAVSYKIAVCESEEIDSRGIGVCNNEVFLNATNNLSVKPELILSDGYTIKGTDYPNKSVIKGDTKSASIAAASIVAKVYRDRLMKDYAEKYPYYSFEENVGYGTSKHIEGIKAYGPCKIHRMSFLKNILDS